MLIITPTSFIGVAKRSISHPDCLILANGKLLRKGLVFPPSSSSIDPVWNLPNSLRADYLFLYHWPFDLWCTFYEN